MMHKQIGAIMLVAGTCIGSGMLALPLVLAHIGLLPSILLMFLNWALAYYTSLIHLELNLQAGTGLTLGQLAKRFSGPLSGYLSNICLSLLSYSLLAVYIYGGSSLLQTIGIAYFQAAYTLVSIATAYSFIAFLVLLLPIHIIDYINRMLFIGLLGSVSLLLTGLLCTTKWFNLPWLTSYSWTASAWIKVIPVLFTSFGFQVIFHTLTNYCNKNKQILQAAFFWGSLIPAILYTIWTVTVIGTIYNNNLFFYHHMVHKPIPVGHLIQELSRITHWSIVQLFSWIISLLALFTSIVGVGVGLTESTENMLRRHISNTQFRRIGAVIITLVPAYITAIFVPNAFITVLGFAGMILVLIAIFIPLYLLKQMYIQEWYYAQLRHTWLLVVCFIAGSIIIGCEIFNLLT